VICVVVLFWCYQNFKTRKTLDVRGKNVLITGCDTGFGRMAAEYLSEKGINVFAACLTEKEVDILNTKKKISSHSEWM